MSSQGSHFPPPRIFSNHGVIENIRFSDLKSFTKSEGVGFEYYHHDFPQIQVFGEIIWW